MPRSIRRFELLWYVSLFFLFVHFVLAALTQGFTQQQQQDAFVGGVVLTLVVGSVVWLAARRRKKWARGILLFVHLVFWAIVLVGTAMLVWRNGLILLTSPAMFGATFLFLGMRFVVLFLQAAALKSAFTDDSREWFRGRHVPQDIDPRVA
jgi:hypothetical protein